MYSFQSTRSSAVTLSTIPTQSHADPPDLNTTDESTSKTNDAVLEEAAASTPSRAIVLEEDFDSDEIQEAIQESLKNRSEKKCSKYMRRQTILCTLTSFHRPCSSIVLCREYCVMSISERFRRTNHKCNFSI